ncbi:MAG: hypothetical protein WB988_13310, partial [Candidatus Nitrosopolaris sp.]
RLTKRFGCNRIKFRLRRIIGLSLSTRTIYKILKRHGVNILKCSAKIRTYKRFAMQHPNGFTLLAVRPVIQGFSLERELHLCMLSKDRY